MSGASSVLHADDVVAGIDVVDLAGDAARQIGQQIERAVSPTSSIVTVRRSGELYSFHFRM